MRKPLNYIKIIAFIAILLIMISCKQKESDSIPIEYAPIEISDKEFNTFLKKCDYIKAIISYYNGVYDETIKDFEKNGYENWSSTENYIKRIPSDTILKISYMITEEKSYDIPIVSILIPIKPNIQFFSSTSFMFGDLDNDQEEDCIITVHTEGNWIASNGYSNDVFVFLNKGNHYELTYFFSSHSLENVYNFDPVLIEKNQILGNTFSYAAEDPRCCPTLYSTMKINLDDLIVYKLKDVH